MKNVFFALLSAWSASLLAQGGGVVGNGGAIASCNIPMHTGHCGEYFTYFSQTDYLLTGQHVGQNRRISYDHSWESIKSVVLENLYAKSPRLAEHFEIFLLDALVHDPSADRSWVPTINLPQISANDPNIINSMPVECVNYTIKQAVIRYANQRQIAYYYEAASVTHMMEYQALQYSYLMVHEWLWDFTDNPVTIRNVNHYLHSQLIEQHSVEEFVSHIHRLGLNVEL